MASTNEKMITEQVVSRGVSNPQVLEAMRTIDRARFVPEEHLAEAYADKPLPLADLSTISQPYIVAFMTELLDPKPHHKVLEIGCGSGYQTAVLATLAEHVYSLEIIPMLADLARFKLRELNIENSTVIQGSGWNGLPEFAPFDGVLVTAAPDKVPIALLDQLSIGGRMVVPVGSGESQDLIVIDKTGPTDYNERTIAPVRFVPMVYKSREQR